MIATRDSRQASRAGKHSGAVDHYLETGNSSRLRQFEGEVVVDLDGNQFPLLTDLDEINRQGNAGNFSFETFYARTA